MYRTPPSQHEFLFCVRQTDVLGCLVSGASWLAFN